MFVCFVSLVCAVVDEVKRIKTELFIDGEVKLYIQK